MWEERHGRRGGEGGKAHLDAGIEQVDALGYLEVAARGVVEGLQVRVRLCHSIISLMLVDATEVCLRTQKTSCNRCKYEAVEPGGGDVPVNQARIRRS